MLELIDFMKELGAVQFIGMVILLIVVVIASAYLAIYLIVGLGGLVVLGVTTIFMVVESVVGRIRKFFRRKI